MGWRSPGAQSRITRRRLDVTTHPNPLAAAIRSSEEHERAQQSGPLVPIHERMIPIQVEETGGRHLEYAGMQRLTIEARLGRRDRRPELRGWIGVDGIS